MRGLALAKQLGDATADLGRRLAGETAYDPASGWSSWTGSSRCTAGARRREVREQIATSFLGLAGRGRGAGRQGAELEQRVEAARPRGDVELVAALRARLTGAIGELEREKIRAMADDDHIRGPQTAA
jgi:hypothetical protein